MFKKALQTVRGQILLSKPSVISINTARNISFVKPGSILDTLKSANYFQVSQYNFRSGLQNEKLNSLYINQFRRFSAGNVLLASSFVTLRVEKVIKVPPMGDAVPEGTLGKWQKSMRLSHFMLRFLIIIRGRRLCGNR